MIVIFNHLTVFRTSLYSVLVVPMVYISIYSDQHKIKVTIKVNSIRLINRLNHRQPVDFLYNNRLFTNIVLVTIHSFFLRLIIEGVRQTQEDGRIYGEYGNAIDCVCQTRVHYIYVSIAIKLAEEQVPQQLDGKVVIF